MTTENNYDGQGNLTGSRVTIAVDNGDGTVTETTTEYDANGNVVKTTKKTKAREGRTEGEAAAQPAPGEVEANPCLRLLHDDPTQARSILEKLQTQIIPKPDAVTPSNDPCLSSFGSSGPNDCVSVLLCLEGAVDDSCRCARAASGAVANPHATTCTRMICPDGTHCDPATGTCVGGAPDNPMFLPGIQPEPFPMPFDGNLGVERDVLGAGLRLPARMPMGGSRPPSPRR
jgi:hypothetical protein